jgi:hypothetical protein
VCGGVLCKYVSSSTLAKASKHAKRRPVTTRERSMSLRGVRHGGFLKSFLDAFVTDSGPRVFSRSAPACKAAQRLFFSLFEHLHLLNKPHGCQINGVLQFISPHLCLLAAFQSESLRNRRRDAGKKHRTLNIRVMGLNADKCHGDEGPSTLRKYFLVACPRLVGHWS